MKTRDEPPPPYEALSSSPKQATQPMPYQQTYGTNTIHVQPHAYNYVVAHSYGAEASTINDYMCWSVFNTVCCCLPFGIVSIILSSQVRDRKATGDLSGARKLSSNAARWNIFTTLVGIVITIVVSIYIANLKHRY